VEELMPLRCLLWDFGDTLADERWMLRPFAGVPAWPEVWSELAASPLADEWNRGRVSTPEIVAELARRLGAEEERVLEHVRSCCAAIRFFETPLAVARASRLPQAIVTVNPDAFSDWIVPAYGLARLFAPIVTSAELGSLDKGAMGLRALEQLEGDCSPGEALLVDNKRHNLEAWAAVGGRGYWFRGEDRFRADLLGELADLHATLAGDAAPAISGARAERRPGSTPRGTAGGRR
jgi:FMN phosphatase YigB (HAD superfamily)